MLIEDALQASLGRFELQNRGNTLKTYRTGLNSFRKYLQEENIDPLTCPTDKLTVGVFLHYPDWLQKKVVASRKEEKKARRNEQKQDSPVKKDETFSIRTARVYLAAVIAFRGWLIEEGLFDPRPQEAARILTRNRSIMGGRKNTSPELEKIAQAPIVVESAYEALDIAQSTVYKDERVKEREILICYRNIAICEVLLSSGLRNHELCNLLVGDLEISEGSEDDPDELFAQALIVGKGEKERDVFFEDKAVRALKQYWNRRGWAEAGDPAIARHSKNSGRAHLPISVVTVEKEIARLASRVGIAFHPHLFRHWYAVDMIKKSRDLALVQDLLGHSDPKTTRIYARLDAQELRKAYREARKQKEDDVEENKK